MVSNVIRFYQPGDTNNLILNIFRMSSFERILASPDCFQHHWFVFTIIAHALFVTPVRCVALRAVLLKACWFSLVTTCANPDVVIRKTRCLLPLSGTHAPFPGEIPDEIVKGALSHNPMC